MAKTPEGKQVAVVVGADGLGLALHLAGDPSAEEQLRKAELLKGFMPLKGDRNRTVTLEDPD